MGKLILIRHGKTVLNSLDDAERLRGWLDISLDSQGFQEAEEIARRVAPHSVGRIYCSDLRRARQTARPLVAATKVPIVYTLALRPWNLGTLAGQRVEDILPVLKRLERDPAMPAPEGESFLEFYERYSRKLWELLHFAKHSPKNIVAVTHVRNLLAAPTVVLGGDRSKIPVKGGPKTGALVWVERKRRQWQLRVDEVPEPAGDTPWNTLSQADG